jgi:hypothetical protein
VASNHNVANFFVTDGTQHFHTILQDVAFNHLLKVNSFGAGAGDYKACIWMVIEDSRDGGCEEIRAFVIEEARDDNNGDGVMGID